MPKSPKKPIVLSSSPTEWEKVKGPNVTVDKPSTLKDHKIAILVAIVGLLGALTMSLS